MFEKVTALKAYLLLRLEDERKFVAIVGNFVVPFTIGYLLHSTLPVSNWRFWAIIILVLAYRGTRGKNG